MNEALNSRLVEFERLSPTQLLVVGSLEVVREARWLALWNEGVHDALIDVEKNLVAGTVRQAKNNRSGAMKANLEVQNSGVLVSFSSYPLSKFSDWNDKVHATRGASWLEWILEEGYPDGKTSDFNASNRLVAPLAEPFGAGSAHKESDVPHPVTSEAPQYGPALSPKRGDDVLYYGLASLFCCPLVGVYAFSYGLNVLADYRREGNPGDRVQVVIGMSLALIAVGATVLHVIGVF